jgi:hypothetical protein
VQKKKRKCECANRNNNDKKKSPNNDEVLQALQYGTQRELQLAGLQLILEFGTAGQKKKAMKEVKQLSFLTKKRKMYTWRISSEPSL